MIALAVLYVLAIATVLELLLEEPKNSVYVPACVVVAICWPLIGVLGLFMLIARLIGVQVNSNV